MELQRHLVDTNNKVEAVETILGQKFVKLMKDKCGNQNFFTITPNRDVMVD